MPENREPPLLYKVLGNGGRPCHGGTGTWLLPQNGKPGQWMPEIEDIVPCRRGYHLLKREHVVFWLGQVIWVAEGRGEVVECTDKIVYSQARLIEPVNGWNDKAARLFACDCVEQVAPRFTKQAPDDTRLEDVIQTARKFAAGDATLDELSAAHEAAEKYAVVVTAFHTGAKYAAVPAAPVDVAYAAGHVDAAFAALACATYIADHAADGTATGAVASAAARAMRDIVARAKVLKADRRAARDAARKWQTDRLFSYLGEK